MHWIDWSIVIVVALSITAFASYTKKYSRSVSDFLAANRCAGRYLIGVAEGMAGLGLVSFVANFEMFYKVAFIGFWWQYMYLPVAIVMTLSGWVIYRFRQTRALTLAQFFEVRYSKRFRVLAGSLALISGVIGMGIIPAVGARFFIYFCGIPETIHVFGWGLSAYVIIMAFLLVISAMLTLIGGQISVMVTDFCQWIFSNITFLVVIAFLLIKFNWSRITDVLALAQSGESMLNPFEAQKVQDFNFWFFAIAAVGMFYNCMAFQGAQGYNCAAKNAHEAKMGRVIATVRMTVQVILLFLVPICAYVAMNHSAYTSIAASAQVELAGIENPQIRTQMTVPVILRFILPVGIMGAFTASMLAAFVAAANTGLHSWGSIFVQDVILPFRKKPLGVKSHIWLLRGSVIGVTIIIFLFSLFFKQTQYIYMYSAMTGSIWLGGAGSVIIGGLYWKKGTTEAAWSALIVGAILGVTSLVITQLPEFSISGSIPFSALLSNVLGFLKQLNGQVLYFYSMMISISTYIIVSLLTFKTPFNIDQMLHRGKYAMEEDTVAVEQKSVSFWRKISGIDKEFSRGDRIITTVIVCWSLLWFAAFSIGCIYSLIVKDVKIELWKIFWHAQTLGLFAAGVIIVIWLSIGGFKDVKEMFRILGTKERNDLDDGTVKEHRNLDEINDESKKPLSS